MSTEPPPTPGEGTSEEELRAAYEAEIKQLRVEHVLLDHLVTMINLGRRRTGLVAGAEDERDPEQVRLAIESARAVLPLIEQIAPEQVPPVRDALSQLQLAYVQIGGQAAAAGAAGAAAAGADAGGGAGGPSEGGAPAGGPGAGGAPPRPSGTPPGAGAEPPPPEPESEEPKPGEPGPAQRSGRLWIPGQ